MTLLRAQDASSPPGSVYPGCDIVFGYLGPEGNTPHIWTTSEWLRFQHQSQGGIYVGANRTNGESDGEEAVNMLHSLGFAAGQPDRRPVVLDMEDTVNPGYINAFGDVVWANGYETWIYESLDVVPHNPVKEGLWVADWDGIAQFPPGAHIIGHQYKADVPWQGTEVDLSAFSAEVVANLGQGPRK